MGNRRLSYANLDEASNKVANILTKIGVNNGYRLALLLANSPEFVTTYFGIAKTGAIAVPLDTKYKLDELSSLFNDFLTKVLVAESPTLEPLVPALLGFKFIRHVVGVSSKYGGQFLSYQEIMSISPTQKIEVALEPEGIAQIAYTSDLSFRPTGIVFSHRHLVKVATIIADGFQQTDKDVMLLFALPMHHMFGLIAVLLASVYKGSAIVIVPGTGLSISSFVSTHLIAAFCYAKLGSSASALIISRYLP